MVALFIGLLLIAFTLIAALPAVLGWGPEIAVFLKGCLPVLSAFVGLIAIFVGIADIKDKNEAKNEETVAKTPEGQKKN
jgi:hypothetical protein